MTDTTSLYSTRTVYKNKKQVGHVELFSPVNGFMGIIIKGQLITGYKYNGEFYSREFHDCLIHSKTAETLALPTVSNRYNPKGEWVGYAYDDSEITCQTRYFQTVEDACAQKGQVGLAEVSKWTYPHQVGPRPRTVTHMGYLDRNGNLISVGRVKE